MHHLLGFGPVTNVLMVLANLNIRVASAIAAPPTANRSHLGMVGSEI